MDEILTMSAKEMARRIREGELSPVKALEAHLARIEQANPLVNAVVVPRFEQARKEAKAAEERLAKGRDDLPPLFGVPCTIKDTFAIKGLTWSSGIWNRRELTAGFDATVVERVQAAGAIVMGKTNVPEAAMWCESFNHVYGRTNNPYDLGRTVGGSSGGEGAAVASSMSPFGIGSDIGGSIRYPSAFNGAPGHKPTGRLVSSFGHFPEAHGPLADFCCYGPLARRVEDLDLVLPLLAGPDGKDGAVAEGEVRSMDSVDVSKVRVFFFERNGSASVSAEVTRAVAMAAGALQGRARAVEHWRPEGIESSFAIWQSGMGLNPDPFPKTLAGGEPFSLAGEVLKFITRTGKITWPALGAALIDGPNQMLRPLGAQSLAVADDLRLRMEDRLADDGVIVCPVFSTPAPKHNHITLNFPGIGYSGVFNVLGFPSTIVPIYHRPDGVPVSVQVVGSRFMDHVTLAAAKALEDAFGGWKPVERVGSPARRDQ